MMAAQLLGTGGIAALLLLAAGTGVPAAVDAALTLALLAAFAAVAFVNSASRAGRAGLDDGRAAMRTLLDIFTVLAVSAGAFFFLAGTVGLLRFPDSLTRLHALTKADNLGLGLVVLGLLPQADGYLAALKLVAVWLLAQLAGATVTQMIARAMRRGGQTGMTVALALDAGLALLVLAVAVWTVAAGPTFAAVVGFVAFGLLLALVWVRLAAVDVALTEAAIGSGVTGAVLIAAAARLRPTEARSAAERPGAILRLVAARAVARWSPRVSPRSCCSPAEPGAQPRAGGGGAPAGA